MWFRHGQKPRPAPTPAPIPAAMVGNGEKGKAYDQLDGADDNRDGNWDGDDDSDSGSDSDGYGDKDLFDDDEEEWVETAARASGEASGINLMKLGKNPPPLPPQSFTVMYDDGSAYRQVVQFPRGNPDELGFVGGPTTLQLPQVPPAPCTSSQWERPSDLAAMPGYDQASAAPGAKTPRAHLHRGGPASAL